GRNNKRRVGHRILPSRDRLGKRAVGAFVRGSPVTFPYFAFAGTVSTAASQTSGLPSEGARQSPRGDREPPDEILGPLGRAERLNWLPKKRRRNSSSQWWIS